MIAPSHKHLIRLGARYLGLGMLFAVIGLCVALVLVPPFLDRVYYDGPASSHFVRDGLSSGHFFNPDQGEAAPTLSSARAHRILWRMATGSEGDERPRWPEQVAVTPYRPRAVVAPLAMHATWVGHATVLIQAGGLNILTDPVWADYVTPFPPMGPKRVAPPGIRFDDLPRIDLVLISHNHYDHLDLPTLRRLWARDHPQIVTPLGNDMILRGAGIPATALDWGQTVTGVQLKGLGDRAVIQCEAYEHCPDYRVTVLRTHHWSSRWGADRNRALWGGFFVRTRAGNIVFAGDTGLGDGGWVRDAAMRGPIRLAILPIGAFRFEPGQLANDSHIGPQQAVEVLQGLGAPFAIPVHWGTFRLSNEGYDTPPRLLDLFMACRGIDAARFRPIRIGEMVRTPPFAPPTPAHAPTTDPAACLPGSARLDALK